jgi:hypothetical protein
MDMRPRFGLAMRAKVTRDMPHSAFQGSVGVIWIRTNLIPEYTILFVNKKG